MVKLRPSVKEDVRALYPEGLDKGFTGVTAEIDGTVAGIAGVYFNRNWIVFARVTPELRKHKLAIYKASRMIVDIMDRLNKPVFAFADPAIPGSDDLLLNMGFEYAGNGWYVWI